MAVKIEALMAMVGTICFPSYDGHDYADLMEDLSLPINERAENCLMFGDFLRPAPELLVKVGEELFPIFLTEHETLEKIYNPGMKVAFETIPEWSKSARPAFHVRPVHARA